MPATTATIYNNMAGTAGVQDALTELTPNPDTVLQLRSDLSSNSRVSVWRLYMWLFAYAAKIQTDLFDLFKADVELLAKDGHYGTRRWFAAKALKFQLGYSLTFTDNDASYVTEDPAARIVTHVAVIELANRVMVKVAKAQGQTLVKLSPAEALAVNDYFQDLRPPVQVTVLTADADTLRMKGAVIYDAQVLLPLVKSAVQAAVTAYLKVIEFGGVLRLTDLKEAMLRAPGVVDVRLDLVEARVGGGQWNSISRVYYSYAGHMRLDPAFNIFNTLLWQAGNV
jgi:hypothetical protein